MTATVIGMRISRSKWVELANMANRFTVRTRINTDLDVADAGLSVGLLLTAVQTRDVCY